MHSPWPRTRFMGACMRRFKISVMKTTLKQSHTDYDSKYSKNDLLIDIQLKNKRKEP